MCYWPKPSVIDGSWTPAGGTPEINEVLSFDLEWLTKENKVKTSVVLGIAYGTGIPRHIIKHAKLFELFVRQRIVAIHGEMSNDCITISRLGKIGYLYISFLSSLIFSIVSCERVPSSFVDSID